MRKRVFGVLLAAAVLPCSVVAQEAPVPQSAAEWRTWVPDPASLEMPALTFAETPAIAAEYDRFHLFHRDGTDFTSALADIRECDALNRGMAEVDYAGGNRALERYNRALPGIGDAMAAAGFASLVNSIQNSAELRRRQTANRRRCMAFKGYARFGLSEARWRAFHFEDSDDDIDEDDRQRLLVLQALVASGPRPALTELGL